MGTTYQYGKHSILSLLEEHPERVYRLYLDSNLRPDPRIGKILELAKLHGIGIQRVPKVKLQQLIDDPEAHPQGVVASVTARDLLELPDLMALLPQDLKTRPPILLALDGITDPRNLGAMLRTAEAAGIGGVILTKHRSAGLGPTVSKASAGADERVPIAVVTNLARSLDQLKKHGFWVAGASLEKESIPYTQLDVTLPLVLIMGSEGEGLGRLIREQCDFLVRIPMVGTVESLNVSVATGILLFHLLQKKDPLEV